MYISAYDNYFSKFMIIFLDIDGVLFPNVLVRVEYYPKNIASAR